MKKHNLVCGLLLTAMLTVVIAGCSSSTSEPLVTSGAGNTSGTSAGTEDSSGSGTKDSDAKWEAMEKLAALDPADITKIGYFVLDEGGGFQGEVTDPDAIAHTRELLLNLTVGDATDTMWTDAGAMISVETEQETVYFSIDGFSVELSDGQSYEVENLGALERYLLNVWQEEQDSTSDSGTSSGNGSVTGRGNLVSDDEFEGSYVFDVDENELVLVDGEQTTVFPGGYMDGPYYMVEKIDLDTSIGEYVVQEKNDVIAFYQNRLADEPEVCTVDLGERGLAGLEYKFSTVDGMGALLHEAEYFESAGAGSAWRWYALYEDGEEDVLDEMMRAIESFRMK